MRPFAEKGQERDGYMCASRVIQTVLFHILPIQEWRYIKGFKISVAIISLMNFRASYSASIRHSLRITCRSVETGEVLSKQGKKP